MLSKIRAGLTYANVMATIAVFLALGGGAYAALKVPKSSVGPKQLKKNAVRSSKVKNHSLRGADIDLTTLGKVPAAALADRAAVAGGARPTGRAGGALAGSYPNPGLKPMEATRHVDDPGQPAFGSGWSNDHPGANARAGFYRDPYGIVHLQGIVSNTGTANAIFVLPVGYRPAVDVIERARCSPDAASTIAVESNGDVTVNGAMSQTCILDGFAFRVGET